MRLVEFVLASEVAVAVSVAHGARVNTEPHSRDAERVFAAVELPARRTRGA